MVTALQGTQWFPSKGVYLNSPGHAAPNDMASDGYDFVICNGVALEKRPGYDRVNSVPISASASVIGLHSLYLSNGNNYELILGSSGTVYTDVNGVCTASAVGGVYISDPVDYCQHLDTGIFVNGSSNPITWNGTVAGNISAAPSAGISCAAHLNKLFIAIKSTSQFKYCATGSLHTWTGAGTDTVNVDQNNGQDIVALKSFARNELIIFKENSMYKFVGETATNFTLIKIDDSIGCSCVKSIKNYRSATGGGLMIWAYRDGIYAYDGTVPRKISGYIQAFWDTLNKSRFKWMDSCIDNDNGRYLLSCSIGSATTNTRIICIDLTQPWTDAEGLHMPITIWRVSAQSLNNEINATTNEQRLVFGEHLGRKSYFDSDLLADNGGGITVSVSTPLMPFDGSLGIENCLRRLFGSFKTTGGTVDLYYNSDDSSDDVYVGQITLDAAGGTYRLGIDFEIGVSSIGVPQASNFRRANISARGERLKVKMESTSAYQGFTMYSPIEFFFKGGGQRA